MKDFAKKAWPDALVVIGFLLIAFVYFFNPLSEGLVLGGHDTVAGMGQGHEQQLFTEATGETTRWTNSIFSGMPTYQIAPSYGPTSLLGKIGWILGLFTTGPLNYIFIYLLGFYLLMRSFRLRPAISALGSVLWAFSSYFFIIIAAGHIWKVNTLGFIPPTIAGLVFAYRGKYLWGCLVTALFTGLQVLSNHIQMTYYFLFPMAFICIAYGVDSLIKHRKAKAAPTAAGVTTPPAVPSATAPSIKPALNAGISPLRHWLRATAAIVVGGLLGAAINLPNLYHTWSYSHESMRGPSELTAAPAPAMTDSTAAEAAAPVASTNASGGLDRDYITQWSYGIDETLTLLIPDFMGGGSASIMDRDGAEELDGYDDWYQHAAAVQEASQGQITPPGIVQYWGEQPFTVGPVYVGAIVCFLFILGLFVVRGPMKWALALATLLSLLFAWGKNIMPITDFFIDYLPMYNKFRTVSSALVVAEFTMPLLGILGLAEVLKQGGDLLKTRRGSIGFLVSFALTAGTCLLLSIAPGVAGPISSQDSTILYQLQNMGMPADFCTDYRNAILAMHGAILSASALRSFLLIVVAALLLVVYMKRPKNVPAWSVVAVILVISLVDMWSVNRRYLNDSNFESEGTRLEGFSKTPADEQILADKDPDFRVLNLSSGNPFNESDNHTAYWHKSIGGYHAAKLHRYQDLIDRYLGSECQKLMGAINSSYNNIIGDSIAAQRFFAEAAAKAPEGADPEAFAEQQLYAEVMRQVQPDSVAPVLCMLNAKWVITGQGGRIALKNPAANGNAWFLTSLQYVDDANAEIAALNTLDLHAQAVADKRFQSALGEVKAAADSTAKAALTAYQPNELHYTLESKEDGVVAFSEVYYPGWSATIDGQPAELGRVNYILRALRVPKGKHEVVLSFRPASITTTNAVAYGSLALLVLGFIFAVYRSFRPRKAE
ncbi:MAG: YfhO family protein [Bacteroidales bacterium]|nr:YfhO family protein [Bacteroidales bacterium]